MTRQAIPKRETLEIEFKSDRGPLNDDDLIEALVCLANAQGGTLYLGVENDGIVTGLHPSRHADIGGLTALVANRTSPPLQIEAETVTLPSHRVAAIRVPRSSEVIARSDGLVKRRRIGGNGQPESVLRRDLHGICHSVSKEHLPKSLSDGERTKLAIKSANGKRLTIRGQQGMKKGAQAR